MSDKRGPNFVLGGALLLLSVVFLGAFFYKLTMDDGSMFWTAVFGTLMSIFSIIGAGYIGTPREGSH
jgi:CDP-diglyceride synthetase